MVSLSDYIEIVRRKARNTLLFILRAVATVSRKRAIRKAVLLSVWKIILLKRKTAKHR